MFSRGILRWRRPAIQNYCRPERIHLDAEYRTHGERVRRNALLRHSRGARHLYAPIKHSSRLFLGEFAVGPDQIEVDLGMVGLSDELVGYAC